MMDHKVIWCFNYSLIIGNKGNTSAWKSKGSSEESIKPTTTPNNSLAPLLDFVTDKIRLKFDGRCLQEKIRYTYKKVVNI